MCRASVCTGPRRSRVRQTPSAARRLVHHRVRQSTILHQFVGLRPWKRSGSSLQQRSRRTTPPGDWYRRTPPPPNCHSFGKNVRSWQIPATEARLNQIIEGKSIDVGDRHGNVPTRQVGGTRVNPDRRRKRPWVRTALPWIASLRLLCSRNVGSSLAGGIRGAETLIEPGGRKALVSGCATGSSTNPSDPAS